MSRRTFIAAAGATAAAAAAGVAACSSDSPDAAAGTTTTGATTVPDALTTTAPAKGGLDGIEHVVIFTQENRSFDLYFGAMNGVRGFGDPVPVMRPGGLSVFQQPAATSTLFPFHLDPKTTKAGCPDTGLPHSWPDAHAAANAGRYDGWVAAKTPNTMGHFTRADLPFHYALADAFTICDRTFCSTMAGTNPNRLHLWTGTIDPDGKAGGPAIFNDKEGELSWTTYPERLEAAGVSWQVYQEADDFSDNSLEWFKQFRAAPQTSNLWKRGVQHKDDVFAWFEDDVANDRLPQVSWVVANSPDSEHPGPSTPWNGAHATHRLLDVLAAHPKVWAKTVFILNYDENDGSFDHVPPPFPVAGTPGEYINEVPIGLGPRVPIIVISPWSTGGWVCSETFDHTSVIRFLERWLGVEEPNISDWRRATCGDLTSAFDFTTSQVAFPDLPATEGAAKASVERGFSALPLPSPPPDGGAMPTVEGGTRPLRPVPYRPTVAATVAADHITFELGNPGGLRPVTFEVYDGAPDGSSPRSFVVPPDETVTELWSTGATYSFAVHGPNGFLRTFEGETAVPRVELTVAKPSGTDLTLRLTSEGGAPTTATLATALPVGTGPVDRTIRAGTPEIVAIGTTKGWYDVTVTVAGQPSFRRRLAGHLESTAPSVTGIGLDA